MLRGVNTTDTRIRTRPTLKLSGRTRFVTRTETRWRHEEAEQDYTVVQPVGGLEGRGSVLEEEGPGAEEDGVHE